MLLASPIEIGILPDIENVQDMIDNYILVQEGYDFEGNSQANATTHFSLQLFLTNELIDYQAFRDGMKYMFKQQSVWDYLTDEERANIIKMAVWPTDFDPLTLGFSDKEIRKFKKDMFKQMRFARVQRAEEFRFLVWEKYELSIAAQVDIQNSIGIYVDYYERGDHPEMKCWLTGTQSPVTGINYATTGYPTKAYYDSVFQQQAIDIFTKGVTTT